MVSHARSLQALLVVGAVVAAVAACTDGATESTPDDTTTGTISTASVLCPYSGTYTGTYGAAGTLTSTWAWTCDGTSRVLTANALPNHAVGTFPNPGNPNTISAQAVNFSATLTPTAGTGNRQIGGPGGVNVYSLAGVKFDPGTGGSCASTITDASQCPLGNGTDIWRIEALGQTTFDFGTDGNNAHVQPTGEYHYHGMPEALLVNAGATDANRKMVLVAWAADGYPVYARYCYSSAMDSSSAVKVCTGSYVKDVVADAGRPVRDTRAAGRLRLRLELHGRPRRPRRMQRAHRRHAGVPERHLLLHGDGFLSVLQPLPEGQCQLG